MESPILRVQPLVVTADQFNSTGVRPEWHMQLHHQATGFQFGPGVKAHFNEGVVSIPVMNGIWPAPAVKAGTTQWTDLKRVCSFSVLNAQKQWGC